MFKEAEINVKMTNNSQNKVYILGYGFILHSSSACKNVIVSQ